MTRWLMAVVVAWGMVGARGALAQEASEVEGLVRELSADSYQAREAAQRRLVGMGAAARAGLERAMAESQDPEARTRIEAALAQIEEDRAVGPSMVSVRFKDAPPEEVLKELSRQGNYPISTMPENLFKQEHIKWPAVTLEVEREPLLKVLRAFCERTTLRVNAMGGDRKFVLMQGGDDAIFGPAVYPGAYMVVMNSVTKTAWIQFGRDRGGASKSLNVQLSFFAEPKLNVMGHDYVVRVTEAVDDRGNSLVPPRAGLHGGGIGQDSSARWTINASLASPENIGSKLAVLRGTNRVLVQARSEVWEVPVEELTAAAADVARPAERTIAGRRYVVEDFKALGADQYQFKLTIVRQGARAEGWQQFGRGVRVTLSDEQGRPLGSRGYRSDGGDERTGFVYTFSRDMDSGQKSGAAARLTVEVPTEVKEQEVPFEFRDVPLP